ncbi:DNA-binding domain-containing protein [Parabacteroides sp.]
MQNVLKGWLVDNTVTTDNLTDKILQLESAGKADFDDIIDEMLKEDTGLRIETLRHSVSLYNRVVARLILSGYSVNTGLFRAVAKFLGVVEGGVWNTEKNSIYVAVTQDKDLREAIAQTTVNILGTKSNVMYILETEDRKTNLKDGTATSGRNLIVRGAMLKVVGSDEAVGVTLTDSKGVVTKLDDDMIASNKPSELMLLVPPGLANGEYTLTITTQYSTGTTLKSPRSVSTSLWVGGKSSDDDDDRPVIE